MKYRGVGRRGDVKDSLALYQTQGEAFQERYTIYFYSAIFIRLAACKYPLLPFSTALSQYSSS